MVFFVVAASLPQNNDAANMTTLQSCTTVNNRPAAQIFPVKVNISQKLIIFRLTSPNSRLALSTS